MKVTITHHQVKLVPYEDWKQSFTLFIKYEYKKRWKPIEAETIVTDIPEEHLEPKILNNYLKTVKKALEQSIKEKNKEELEQKRFLNKKKDELKELREFVKTRTIDWSSLQNAIKEYKERN